MVKKYFSEVRVLYADTDAMGIVYYGNYAKWFELGRCEFLRQAGHPYSELEREGIWLPVIEIVCNYKHPAVYDDVLEIAAWLGELNGASLAIEYEIRKKETGALVVVGRTRHAVTDHSLKPVKIRRDYPELYAFMRDCLKDD
ncbi:MAG: acyl-CoA thioesterase [Clostridiales Family XIII bacterium]|nr:acyl-CoA thioesterase [Clostridiales Family XIII bacterium]